jgi:hypothetical protein
MMLRYLIISWITFLALLVLFGTKPFLRYLLSRKRSS